METQFVSRGSAHRDHVRHYSFADWSLHIALLSLMAFALLPISSPGFGADLEYGAYLASECTTCHRADGEVEGIPAIVGWDEHHFIDALKAYLGTERDNPTMRTIVKRLTDEDMEALAAYFRSLAD